MGELDFRKKRKNTNIRGTARKQGKNSRQRELRFENEKREKRSSGKRWGKNKKRDRFVGSGTFARMYDGGFSRSSFRTESECYRRFDVACFKKRKCCDDKSLYL